MKLYREEELCALVKKYRLDSGKSRAEVASELGVSKVSIFNAEETPGQSLTKLRIRIIEAYSPLQVAGPMFLLKPK